MPQGEVRQMDYFVAFASRNDGRKRARLQPSLGAMLFKGFTAMASPSPRSGEGGRRPDGVRKAGMVGRRLGVSVVQTGLRRSGGPHPIRRSAPPSPASWVRGSRRLEMCESRSPVGEGRSLPLSGEGGPKGRMRVSPRSSVARRLSAKLAAPKESRDPQG